MVSPAGGSPLPPGVLSSRKAGGTVTTTVIFKGQAFVVTFEPPHANRYAYLSDSVSKIQDLAKKILETQAASTPNLKEFEFEASITLQETGDTIDSAEITATASISAERACAAGRYTS